MRDTSFLGKLLALTESTNPHEANLAKAKLEQQLEKRGINLDQLEQQLGDMSVVEEEIEVIAFRYGQPYKRVDPAVSILLSAVCHYYNLNSLNNKSNYKDWSTFLKKNPDKISKN